MLNLNLENKQKEPQLNIKWIQPSLLIKIYYISQARLN